MLRLHSLVGVVALLALCFLLSRDRGAVKWRLVLTGLGILTVVGWVFLGWSAGNQWLQGFAGGVKEFLDLGNVGARFVFRVLAEPGSVNATFHDKEGGFIFATQVLPTLIFFSSLMSVLYHLGIMQLVVRSLAVVMLRVMRTSGSESLSACANIFVGQTEAPLLVRPFLGTMTKSELHAVMTGGFATIAGGVFVLYAMFGIDPGHLMVASLMGAPAGLVVSKILWPETEVSKTMGRVEMTDARTAGNVVEAAANGAIDGMKLALNVGAMLIAFLGLVAVIDWMLGAISGELSFGRILGWIFYPIAAVMGVPSAEVATLSQLLGTKIALTELVAYSELGQLIKDGAISERTRVIASFALCGFANVASIAIQIGGLGAIAPERKTELSLLAPRAMFAGAIATCITACVAGVLSHA